MKFVPEEDCIERTVDICLYLERNGMTLRKEWDVRTYKTCFEVHEFETTPTTRTILSHVVSIFDPVGFIALGVLLANLLMQDTRPKNLAWNAKIPRECFMRLDCRLRSTRLLSKLLLSRCLVPESYKPLATQIQCFADASKFAYGVVAYAPLPSS